MITTHIVGKLEGIDISLPRLKKLVRAICRRFEIPQATISIAIVDDTEIRKINKQFLNHNFTTDCLSFDLSESNQKSKSFELVANGQRALKEASRRGHSAEAELALYITHGLLHNLGFDDSQPSDAKKMHDTEDEILQQQGFGLVYNKSE